MLVLVTDRFAEHLEALGDYIAKDNPARALSWVSEVEQKVAKLDTLPEAHPYARENELHPIELRQLVFGRGAYKYRIIFTVRTEDVVVLDIRRCAQEEPPITFEENQHSK